MENLIYFLIASAVLTISPGPDIVFVFTQGLTRGRAAGVVTALGLASGTIVHTTLAAFGVSAIFRTSSIAFNMLKIAGCLYLLLLAWGAIIESSKTGDKQEDAKPASKSVNLKNLYRTGLLMNLLNPKVALFFLAFLPQFVAADSPNVAMRMIVLGAIFMAQTMVIFSAVGCFAAGVGNLLPRSRRAKKAMDYARAAVLILLAGSLLWASI